MTIISLDLETWGKRAGCDLRSIGAVVLHDHGVAPRNSTGQFYLAVENPILQGAAFSLDDKSMEFHTLYDVTSDQWRTYPLCRDPETVQWWSEQSPEAQGAFGDAVDLRQGLQLLSIWFAQVGPVDRIYTHGAAFDLPILEAAYHAVGLPVPWYYRAARDTRTLFDAARIEDHSAFLAQFNTGTHHNALDDAITQGEAIIAAMRILQQD